jgi:hypothetical protein
LRRHRKKKTNPLAFTVKRSFIKFKKVALRVEKMGFRGLGVVDSLKTCKGDIYIYIYICMYVCIHRHTHTHTYPSFSGETS